MGIETEPGLEKRWSLFDTLPDIVDEKFTQGMGKANDAWTIANETILALKDTALQLEPIETDLVLITDDLVVPSIDDFVGDKPIAPTIELTLPEDLSEADNVFNAVEAKLHSDIENGSAAISDSVETAIFERELERARLAHADELDNISAEWSKRGFVLPDGILASNLAASEINFSNKRLDVSRDVAIKSFELADTNTKFAIEWGIRWYATRIETYKAKIQAEIARIEALVKAYVGEAEVYKASAAVYTALTDAKIKKFEAEIRKEMVNSDLLVKQAEISMKNYEMLNNLKIEAYKSVAAVASQVAAGGLASVGASVHLQAQNTAEYQARNAELFLT